MARLVWTTAALLGILADRALGAARTTTVNPESTQTLPPAGTTGGGGGVASGMGGSLLRLGIGLLVVVALIVGVWLVLRRMQRGALPGFAAAADLVEVVTTTPLGPNRFLHLVRVGEELILVGATEHAVTPVLRVGADEAVRVLDDALDADAARDAYAQAQARTGAGVDPRVRAAATARTASLVERLRALTTRR